MGYYRHHIFCCVNRREAGHPRGCCAEKGAELLRDYFKSRIKELGLNGTGKVRINQAGCLDRCELGPVLVIYPGETWYYAENERDIDEIIESHVRQGVEVERLRLPPEQKRR